MLNVAYLANKFPAEVEPYVWEEIAELRRCGSSVVPCSVWQAGDVPQERDAIAAETVYLFPLSFKLIMRSARLYFHHIRKINELLQTLLTHRSEPWSRRFRAIAHTLLGIYYAALLKERRIDHIHVHHGYFAAWIAMAAACVLDIPYSMTLHGSDLLVHRAFLDLKLKKCKFCLTISEFNRRQMLANYPGLAPEKIRVQRMGVEALSNLTPLEKPSRSDSQLILLAVGRLHAVKDHAFLIRACAELKSRQRNFVCMIAGEGPERPNLEKLIQDLNLQQNVTLLGHVSRAKLETYYSTSDLVVLTSRSEGIPLTLMEAMVHGRAVLAPAITGIPELVVNGVTGFLYRPGSIEDFLAKIELIHNSRTALRIVRFRARQHVLENFNRTTNLAEFAEVFTTLVAGHCYESSLLQQI